ncbi:alpha/beta fold hydrolase [Rossellomorea sp. FS2]|uniref:alpha/beta fold hydrolase n=1 Tax=Rossellomorea sp. FS2 TaxID=3391447 RepID=UPI003A4D5D23
MKKKRKRGWLYVRNGLAILLILCIGWSVFSTIMTAYEQGTYHPPGERVDVDGKKMHVYSKGTGDETIVLMSGLGTAAPVLDFAPLIDELSKKHRVVVVEAFGYGWSDLTETDRTVENIVREMRAALSKADIQGPYILMPHSVSGIYSMYYADQYPEEVKAVIGIDPTLPGALDYFNESPPAMPGFLKYVAPSGIGRLALMIDSRNFLPEAGEGTYSKENLDQTKAISAWKGYNRNVVAEANAIKKNIDQTKDMAFPADMPVLFFTKEAGKTTADGKNNVTFLETQLTTEPASRVVPLDGHHYLHWTRSVEMSRKVDRFVESFR